MTDAGEVSTSAAVVVAVLVEVTLVDVKRAEAAGVVKGRVVLNLEPAWVLDVQRRVSEPESSGRRVQGLVSAR